MRATPRRAAPKRRAPTDWRGWRRRWELQQTYYLPARESRFDAMFSMLEVRMPPSFEAIDLACGPGAISERLLARFPRARCTAVDLDPVLLALGRHVLGEAEGRLSWVEADLRESEWLDRLPSRPVDAVLTTTALHWLTESELAGLYRQIASLLRKGGLFLNGDYMAYPRSAPVARSTAAAAHARASARERALHQAESWEEWWSAIAREPGLAKELAERGRRFPRAHGDEPEVPFATHERLLRDSGFGEVEVIWSLFDNRVLCAVRLDGGGVRELPTGRPPIRRPPLGALTPPGPVRSS